MHQSIGQRLRVQEGARADEAAQEARRKAEAELETNNAMRAQVRRFEKGVWHSYPLVLMMRFDRLDLATHFRMRWG